jgi:hypothetical protein
MTMPRLDGAATFRELQRICEDVQVSVMSGYNAFAQRCFGPLARGDIIRYRQHRIHLAPSA